MSNYGYNPDEHFQTKVTLIDKDGFHKESDEVPGGGSSGSGLEEGIYTHRNAYMVGSLNNGIHTSVIIDCEKYPEIFENYYNYSAYPHGACVYFGEKMLFDETNFSEDEGNIFYNDEALQTYIANNDKTVVDGYGSDGYDTRINEKYALHTMMLFESDGTIYNTISGMPNGTPVHFIGVYCPLINEDGIIRHSRDFKLVYIDDVWNVVEE